VTYNTLLKARSKYGSLLEVRQCLAIYQDMRNAGYEQFLLLWSTFISLPDGSATSKEAFLFTHKQSHNTAGTNLTITFSRNLLRSGAKESYRKTVRAKIK